MTPYQKPANVFQKCFNKKPTNTRTVVERYFIIMKDVMNIINTCCPGLRLANFKKENPKSEFSQKMWPKNRGLKSVQNNKKTSKEMVKQGGPTE